MIKILQSDNRIQILAKMAANICFYAKANPLHCFFEDGNFHLKPLDYEKDFNTENLEANGFKMYKYILCFINHWNDLDDSQKKECFNLYRKQFSYLNNKCWNKIERSRNGGRIAHNILNDDDSISFIASNFDPKTESKFDFDELPIIPSISKIDKYVTVGYIIYINNSKYKEFTDEDKALEEYRKLESRFYDAGHTSNITLQKISEAVMI